MEKLTYCCLLLAVLRPQYPHAHTGHGQSNAIFLDTKSVTKEVHPKKVDLNFMLGTNKTSECRGVHWSPLSLSPLST